MIHSLKQLIAGAVVVYAVLVFLILAFVWSESAIAVELDPAARTVLLNPTGEQITLTADDLMRGQKKFSSSCAQCHIDGGTKTNPDVDLSTETLALATPARDSVEGIMSYLEDPMTYDGLQSLAELHPSRLQPDLFPRMRSLKEDDLEAIAGYILAQPKIVGEQWAGGKPRR